MCQINVMNKLNLKLIVCSSTVQWQVSARRLIGVERVELQQWVCHVEKLVNDLLLCQSIDQKFDCSRIYSCC